MLLKKLTTKEITMLQPTDKKTMKHVIGFMVACVIMIVSMCIRSTGTPLVTPGVICGLSGMVIELGIVMKGTK
jgi:hypothetical protein